MKVTYVLSQGQGGIPHYTAELANAMSAFADVSVLKPSPSTADGLFRDAVTVHDAFDDIRLSSADLLGEFDPLTVLYSIRSFRNVRQVRDIDPDIVHFPFPASVFPHVQLFTKRYGIDRSYPLVETYHHVYPNRILRRGWELHADEPLSSVLFANATHAVERALPSLDRDHTIVHTPENRRTLVENGRDPLSISVLPHGVYNFFTEFDHSDVSEERNALLLFGNLVPSKAPDVAIRAIPHVAERIDDVTLIVAGSGSLSPESKRIIREYPNHFEVHNRFIPNERVGEFFRRAQLVVVPHRRQSGHSGTLTISFAYNTPTVVSDIDAYAELMSNPECGVTAPVNDPDGFADAIVDLLRDSDRRERMRENTETMNERLSWDNIAREHLDRYRSLVAE